MTKIMDKNRSTLLFLDTVYMYLCNALPTPTCDSTWFQNRQTTDAGSAYIESHSRSSRKWSHLLVCKNTNTHCRLGN